MKFAAYSLLLISLAATFAYSQTNNIPQVQHVIVVIQENRTPDNLFQQDQNSGHQRRAYHVAGNVRPRLLSLAAGAAGNVLGH
jgi:phospholipase C